MRWSLVSRLIHWFIAIPVLLDFFLEGGDPPHRWVGYVALLFVLVRIAWGFVTKDEGAFRKFTPDLKRGVYALIWLMVFSLGITGHMMGTDAYWGVEWVEDLHDVLADILMILVLLHLSGIALDAWKFKRKTWLRMINGR